MPGNLGSHSSPSSPHPRGEATCRGARKIHNLAAHDKSSSVLSTAFQALPLSLHLPHKVDKSPFTNHKAKNHSRQQLAQFSHDFIESEKKLPSPKSWERTSFAEFL